MSGSETSSKRAIVDSPIHPPLADRWSPYGLDGGEIEPAELRSIFEAGRWAPSAFNEQPWRWIIATREDTAGFDRLLACLVEPNRAWALHAGALAIGVTRRTFARNDKPNSTAAHDLGLASMSLTVEAVARGLATHMMSGILPDVARETYGIPDEFDVVLAIAFGRVDRSDAVDEGLRGRDDRPRSRRPLAETVFEGAWDRPWSGLSR